MPPFFYISDLDSAQRRIRLDEDASKHVVQVLRMRVGESLNLTDGKGNLFLCEIAGEHKKHCEVIVKDTRHKAQDPGRVSIGISLLKNTSRFEWFLEKATEIGVAEIIPLVCGRTEKQKFRFDRMLGICTSAMLQSQQVWLPTLHEPVRFDDYIHKRTGDTPGLQKFIAYCDDPGTKKNLLEFKPFHHSLVLIGPEGDFTRVEIDLALKNDFAAVSLGETRLRSETAGVVAAALVRG